MTDEEMAVKYVREHTGFNVKEPLGKIAVRTYLAGLTACRPKWHKVAEKLPPLWEGLERTSIRVVDNYDRIIIYDYESERWRDLEGDSLGIQPDYWCEIPQFKE